MSEPTEIPVVDSRPDRSLIREYDPFVPILDRVLVKRLEVAKDSDGFAVPEKYRQSTNKGEVLGVGTRVTSVKTGDIVLYGEFTAEKLTGGDAIFIVREADIRGVERLRG